MDILYRVILGLISLIGYGVWMEKVAAKVVIDRNGAAAAFSAFGFVAGIFLLIFAYNQASKLYSAGAGNEWKKFFFALYLLLMGLVSLYPIYRLI